MLFFILLRTCAKPSVIIASYGLLFIIQLTVVFSNCRQRDREIYVRGAVIGQGGVALRTSCDVGRDYRCVKARPHLVETMRRKVPRVYVSGMIFVRTRFHDFLVVRNLWPQQSFLGSHTRAHCLAIDINFVRRLSRRELTQPDNLSAEL